MSDIDEDDNWTQIQDLEGPDDIGLTLLTAKTAREHALLDLLPSLLVHLLDIEGEDIPKGLPRADGSRALVSLENQQLCILGLKTLVRGDLPYPECMVPDFCIKFREKQIQEFVAPPTTLAPVKS